MDILDAIAAEGAAPVDVKNQLFDRYDRCESAEDKVQTAHLLAELLCAIAPKQPAKAALWAHELSRRVFYEYSEADQIRQDRPREVARLFGVCHELHEQLADTFDRLSA